MFETLFGAEMPLPVRFFIAFLIVLGLMGVTFWIIRKFGAERLGATTARGRQPRLAVIDAAPVDGRRRLILIRRDNVEHLLMIGGPTDVVVEANIVRAAAASAGREAPAPTRAPAAEALPRTAPSGDTGMWPLQPEPVPVPPPRPVRAPVPEEPVQWSMEPELPPPPPRRQPQPSDPLSGLAAELARAPELPRSPAPFDLGGGFPTRPQREPLRQRPALREPAPEPEPEPDYEPEPEPIRAREPARHRVSAPAREPVREQEPEYAPEPEPVRAREPVRMREPQPVREPQAAREPQPMREAQPMREPHAVREPQAPTSMTDADFNANADQNLAEMAQRLEAALRRPGRATEPRAADAAPRAPVPAPEAAGNVQPLPSPTRTPATEAAAPRAEPKPAKSLYDSLEKEMASLLGRPGGKS